jgi:hypothetical protein
LSAIGFLYIIVIIGIFADFQSGILVVISAARIRHSRCSGRRRVLASHPFNNRVMPFTGIAIWLGAALLLVLWALKYLNPHG